MEVINLFWDKNSLTKLENLCVLSYLENNHLVNLFTYDTKSIKIKHKNLNIIDANEIISEKEKFYYSGAGDCPNNSIVGFSDIFRYEVLFKIGGWYSDLDVVNFKNLTSISSYDIVLRPHIKYKVVSNICKFPKGYEPLLELKNLTIDRVKENNSDWSLPLKLFSNFVDENKLNAYILSPELLGDDNDKFIYYLLFDNYLNTKKSIENFFGIHWCKTAFSSGNWNARALYNFDNPKKMTLLDFLYYKYL